MKHIGRLPWKFHVREAFEELLAHPELWNEFNERTAPPTSPHREVDDIWLRYNSRANLADGLKGNTGPFESIWYPSAKVLPACRELACGMYRSVHGIDFGGVLITRIPPGKQVYPHFDGGWHAQNYEKYAIQIQGNLSQAFCYEDGQFACKTGEAFWFENHITHWVTNPSEEPRITMIVCVRRS